MPPTRRKREVPKGTGAAKGTILRLLADVGAACDFYQSQTLRGLSSRRIQCDEIWAYCYAKERNVPREHKGEYGYGDIWTWVALDPDSKLVVCLAIGRRDSFQAKYFNEDLSHRVSGRIQLTTDGRVMSMRRARMSSIPCRRGCGCQPGLGMLGLK